ncbi:MAG: ROK family protein [Peptoniphilaceae bacterium]|nr:ROK family protein [Peptoniphilaceae bacterium]MDD7382958.1 ROK family protein [Peptoniphilaceae bacterium]MDY3737709.1 ROK family protein [Peptoniphilaceae bacterium]
MEYVIGVDVGGTKINAALIDESGEIIEKVKITTDADKGREVVLSNIKKAIYKLPYKNAKAIGIGTPGFIDSKNGIVTFAGNIEGRTGLNLKKAVEEFVDKEVFVENDANVALLCEKWVGSAKNYDSVVMITLGTGLGGAIYTKEGGLLSGAHFQGGELGHMILYPNGRKCTCGQNGCAEAYCAGSGITSSYFEKTGFTLSGEEIFNRADIDEKAKEVLEEYQFNLANYLSSLRNIFDPEAIIIGGGVINSKNIWWDGMIDQYYKVCNKPDAVSVIPATYLNDSGVIGAGKAAFDRSRNV